MKSRFFGRYVISTLPKLGEMLEALQFDLRTKFGPLSAVKKGSKKFRFVVLTPKPEVVFAIFFVPFCRSLSDVGYGRETKSISYIVNEKTKRGKGGKNSTVRINVPTVCVQRK